MQSFERSIVFERVGLTYGNKPALSDIGLETLDDAHGRWEFAERRQLGSDCFEAYERRRS